MRDHRTLARYGYTAGFAGLVLLALPGLLPSSISEVNGAKIWLRLAIFSIQPGEFAKILLIVFFAAFLVQKRELFTSAGRTFLGMEFPRARDLAPLLVAWALALGVLVLESDLGTSLLFFGIVLVMLYAATERVSWVLIGLTALRRRRVVAYQLFGHVRVRVQVWLDPFADFNGAGYQIGAGAVRPRHRRRGRHRPRRGPPGPRARSPRATSCCLARRGAGPDRARRRSSCSTWCSSPAGCAARWPCATASASCWPPGLSFAIALQLFIVVGGATKLIPLTGLTLPFLSYGGSSLVANYALVALLLRISNAARAPLPRRAPAAAADRGGHRAGGAAAVNTPVRRIAIAVMAMVLLLFANLTYVQVVKAGDYRNDPRNQRVLLAEYSRQRGQISAERPGAGLSAETNDRLRYLRTYPDGPEYAPSPATTR